MPLATVTTNVNLDDSRRKLLLQTLTQKIAELLAKPERLVMVAYQYNADMLFAGSAAPLAFVELKSIGLPAEQTSAWSKALCRELEELCAIDSDRIYIEFTNAARNMWGWNQGTFA